ncbi:sensor histidine kinase [Polymorphobacter fuscus]|uniref:ATPase n=1 Tax=Sandarakinorhabdus fusca TaxID=1439888 RepID=A0A7C9GRD7_9SPHN|nr:two-component regulator propeller domain-containing protein [Polymorphobacter fuscus]KAB7644397.1 ATPase [Polymorphobacter fuscus]MQT18316.1 ATPase [Polymorphobacter fuscus]NJC08215.1 signal transduction histidine kinase/ligand-binding sensor domain-containing protein [Polymorphobacter fuscus]
MSSVAKFILLATLAPFASVGDAFAKDAPRSLGQLQHTTWSAREGAPPEIWALAQSNDGYLWLGTGSGLYRFDGANFEKFRPRKGEHLPSLNVNSLLATRGGDLWIGFASGAVARLRGGHLTLFDLGLPPVPVLELSEDRGGAIWAALGEDDRGGVARFRQGRWERIGPSYGVAAGAATSVLGARDGSVWAAAGGELAVLRRGARRFSPVLASASDRPRLKQSPDGAIWLTTGARSGLQRVTGLPAPAAAMWFVPPMTANPRAESILFDRYGSLWGTYGSGGVFRLGGVGLWGCAGVANGEREKFGAERGLTSNLANPILEDREGNIWVGTNLGLDQFREASVAVATGLPTDSRNGFRIARGRGGAMYITSNEALFMAHPRHAARMLVRLPRRTLILHTDALSRTWIGTDGTLGILSGTAVRDVPLPWARRRPFALVEDGPGRICISSLEGAFCRNGRDWAPEPRLATPGTLPMQMLRDAAGRIWIAEGGRIEMVDGARRRVFSARHDLALGTVMVMAARGRHVYAGGDFGLARFDGRRFVTLRSDINPFLSRTAGIVETSDGDLWLNTVAGAVRIAHADVDDAFAHTARPVKARVFDRNDGMPGAAQQDSWSQTVMEAADGRLWFVTRLGIAWIDPKRLSFNTLPPPVIVRSLISGGSLYATDAPIRLPKGASNLQIAYTATSLSVPSRVRFRYQLEGVDDGWVDAGTRREAFYTGLKPGTYRFRVIASNNDGVWNRTGAMVEFTIPPTFLQSELFLALCGLALFGLLWLAYSLRLQAMASRIRMRMAERLEERERIARELHDTLLQSFQALTLRFQLVADELPITATARPSLEAALDRADQVIAEGRDRVLELRSLQETREIAVVIGDLIERQDFDPAVTVKVVTVGKPRALSRMVMDELCYLASEAIFNIRRHASAKQVHVEIGYNSDFSLRFIDDGIGMDPAVALGGTKGHFGLSGMRERARKLRGNLLVRRRAEGGTEVALTVPGAVAYEPSRRGLFARLRKAV